MPGEKVVELERRVAAEPANPGLRHLLAAEYVQAGELVRAGLEFYQVLALNPAAHVARLQWGLLELTSGEIARALEIWAPLEALPDGTALKFFKQGLEALIRNEFGTCARLLNQGIAANTENAPLNDDMRRVLARLPASAHAEPDDAEELRTDFSLYGVQRH
jgi:tetratricopeptide (TPR) repeat protein